MSGSRKGFFFGAGCVVSVMALAASLPASAAPAARAGAGQARAALALSSGGSADPANAGLTTLGLGGWQVQNSTDAPQSGADISAPGFSTSGWLQVQPDDAGAPGTEIEALVQNGRCPDVFFSDNLRKCFGFTTDASAVTIPPFNVPWWYRTDFDSNLQPGQHATLIVNGIVGQADAWVNGHEVATQDVIQGAYPRYSFDVTGLLQNGTNTLALEVYPNDPSQMFTLDNVDWTQIPPDNNTGIQFPVQLHVSDAVGLSNAHVTQNDAPDLSTSALTVKADVTNNTDTAQTATVKAVVTPPNGGGGAISVQQSVTVPANQTTTVSFAPAGYPNLTINHPQLWWPYQMGDQPLYTLDTQLLAGGNARQQLDRAVRHPHDHDPARRARTARAGRSAPVPGQRPADRHPRRRLRPEPPPALLRAGHCQPDRADEGHGHQRDPARGSHDAGRLLHPAGQGWHPERRRLPVLRRLAGRPADRADAEAA